MIVGGHRGSARQQGAVLVVAMLILLLLSMISLSSADQSILQERMASNQHTQANSFLAAEAGITAAKQVANDVAIEEAASGGDADAIESAWVAKISQYESWNAVGGKTGAAEFRISRIDGREDYWDEDTKTFDVLSQGRLKIGPHGGASRALGARITPAQSSIATSSPFLSALLGREGVSISASGRIDTYNSDYGAYDEDVTVDGETFTNNNSKSDSGKLEGVSARTCTFDATINLSGYAPIYGDVLGTGNLVSQGSPQVYGKVRVNGDANFNGYVYGNFTAGGNADLGTNAHIIGNVRAGGYFRSNGNVSESDSEAEGTVAQGTVTVDGDATFTSASVTAGAVTAGGDVAVDNTSSPPPSIRAGGRVNSKAAHDNYIGNLPSSELDIPGIVPVDSSQAECGSEQNSVVAERFFEVRNDSRTRLLSDWLVENGCSAGSKACFLQSNGDIDLNGNNQPLALGTSGKQTLLELPGALGTTGSLAELDIRGDVTLLVGGDFDLGDRTTLNMGSTGTLTLMVTGKTTFSRGSKIVLEGGFVRENTNGESVPAILVYSTYESDGTYDPGVVLSGYNDAYIAVYAPDASVDVAESGDIYGSVVANEIAMTGSGAIHFDEALKRISFGESTDSELTDARITSWWELTTIQ